MEGLQSFPGGSDASHGEMMNGELLRGDGDFQIVV